MKTHHVGANVSPLVSHTLKKHKGPYDRLTLEIAGVRKTIFGQIQTDHGDKVTVKVFNHPSGTIDIRSANIATIESGYVIWEQSIKHHNDGIVGSYYHKSSEMGVNNMVRYGALHPKVATLSDSGPSGMDFTKATEHISPSVKI